VIVSSYINAAVRPLFEIFQSGAYTCITSAALFQSLQRLIRSHPSDLFFSKTYDLRSLFLATLSTYKRRHTLVSCWSAIYPLSSFPALAVTQQRLFPRRPSLPTYLPPSYLPTFLPFSLYQQSLHRIWSR
jgi:hypothetical protein